MRFATVRVAARLACCLPGLVCTPVALAGASLPFGTPKGIATIGGTVDYSRRDAPQNWRFFDALEKRAGQIVYLRLKIVANSVDDYTVVRLDKKKPADDATCGKNPTSGYGHMNGPKGLFRVAFQHPKHSHNPVYIVVGNRIDYPYQELICSVEGYTERAVAPLIIRGLYRIYAAEIPTAVQYELYPVKFSDLR